MPLVDMPLAELKKYQGISPRPADFDEYWERALAEMNAIDPNCELIKYEFASKIADCYDLYFTSTKGARIHGRFWKPKQIDGKIPALLGFHGLGGHTDSWPVPLAYVSQGFCVAQLDCRGQAGTSQDVGVGEMGSTLSNPFIRGLNVHPDQLLCRDLFLDTAMLARIVMGLDYVDETRVGTYGGSQGGALSIACACLVPTIKLCSARYPYLSDYKRVWEMDLAQNAYEGLKYYFRQYDPRHERENEVFEKLGYIDLQHLAHRMKAKFLMATGLMDTICPPSTQFAIYNKVTSEKQSVIYPDFGHEWLKGNDEVEFEFLAQL